jgi:protein phosphatase 2C-like protein
LRRPNGWQLERAVMDQTLQGQQNDAVGGRAAPAPREDRGTRWRVVGVSQVGAGHRRSATPCQDANAFLRIDEDWLAIAVADGAGSAAKSELGAGVAVKVAVTTLAESFRGYRQSSGPQDGRLDHDATGKVLLRVLSASRLAVEAKAQEFGVAPGELACTLIVVLLGPDRVAAAQIGDGGAVIELADGRIETLLRPDSGEYLNETTFLTSARAMKSVQVVTREESVRSVAVLTDGLQMLALRFPDWTPFEPFFAPVFAFLRRQPDQSSAHEEVSRMLESDGVRTRTHDDVTLLVATRLDHMSEGGDARV